MKISKEFEQALESFVSEVDKRHKMYLSEKFPNSEHVPMSIVNNPKYIKLVKDKSAFSFVDADGNILFAKSWNTPDKKNIRGNIFSQQNGMEANSEKLNYGRSHPHIKYLK